MGAAIAALLLASACTPAAEPEARAAAEMFQAALRARGDNGACQLLSDEARSNLESAAATSCATALPRLKLPPDPVGEVSVWGDDAQVKVGSDALFLAKFSSGWKVTGAGCSFRSEDMPYDCDVEG